MVASHPRPPPPPGLGLPLQKSGTSAGFIYAKHNAPACFAFDVDPVRTKEIDFRSLASGRVAQGRRLRVAHRAASPRDRSPRDQAISLDLRGPSTQTKWSESHTSGWVPPPAILETPVYKSHMSGPFKDWWASLPYYSDPSLGSTCTPCRSVDLIMSHLRGGRIEGGPPPLSHPRGGVSVMRNQTNVT